MRHLLPILVSLAALPAPTGPAAAAQAPPAPAMSATPASDLFVVFYRPGPAWQAGRPMSEQGLRPHGLYYRGLLDSGRLQAGGAYVGSDGGLAILRAADLAEARAIVAADPAVTGGIFVAEIEQWRPRFISPDPIPAPPASR